MMMLTTPGQKLQMPSSLDGRPGLVPTSHGSTSDPKSAKKMLLQHKTFQKNVFDLQDAWMLFLIYLAFSKFSQVKLGADDSIPEFNNITWWAKTLIAPNNFKLQVFNALCLWYRIWPVFLLCVWTNLPLHRLFLHLRKHPLLVNQTHRFVSHLWKQPAKIQQVKIDSLPTPACLIIV